VDQVRGRPTQKVSGVFFCDSVSGAYLVPVIADVGILPLTDRNRKE